MRDLAILRKVERREGRRAMGVEPRGETHLPVGIVRRPHDAEHLALPQYTDYLSDIQKSDGSFYFMVSFSRVGGPDTVA
jgi:hypothetical protein